MRKLLLAVVGLGVGLAWFASVAAAQAPSEDSVVGYVEFFAGSNEPPGRINFNVHSAPSGENPVGDVNGSTVGCVHVNGSTAVVGVVRGDQGAFFFSLVDGPVDMWTSRREPGPVLPNDCKTRFVSPSPDPSPSPIELVNDFVITDAQPPSRYSQCRLAGWVKYGFASHADCIDAVHQLARQKCIFERVAHGIAAFRAKYGLPPDQHHAMRHCVRLYTGF
jgi:hypothetical protein